MEEPSKPLSKRCTMWKGLVLTACLLVSWHLSTAASVTTRLVPPHVAEGENVLFLVYDLPENITALAWFKERQSMNQGIAKYELHKNLSGLGPVHSGRETLYPNGSLLFKNVTKKDTGFYTLRTYNRRGKIISTTSTYLYVHAFIWKCGHIAASAQVRIESVPPRVDEGKSVLLVVRHPPENILGFLWYKGLTELKNFVAAQFILDKKPTVLGPAYSGRETLYSDGSLLLHSVTQKDPGLYTLRILRTYMKSVEAHVQLQVDNSFYSFCNLLTFSQLKIQPVPKDADEGEAILLEVHNLPEDLLAFSWHKLNDKTPGLKIVEYSRDMNSVFWWPTNKGKWIVYNNGSLLIQSVTKKDEGIYKLEVLNKHFSIEKAFVEFYVKQYVTQPFVQITDTTVTGSTAVIFTCLTPDTEGSILWILNNKTLKLTERMTLSPTRCGLRIDPVRTEDAGEYQCEVSNRFSVKTSFPISWP